MLCFRLEQCYLVTTQLLRNNILTYHWPYIYAIIVDFPCSSEIKLVKKSKHTSAAHRTLLAWLCQHAMPSTGLTRHCAIFSLGKYL